MYEGKFLKHDSKLIGTLMGASRRRPETPVESSKPNPQMPTLVDLLEQYPIIESLSCHLGLGDLIALSRTSSTYRAVLHGLPNSPPAGADAQCIAETSIRLCLNLGSANTRLWKLLKANTRKICSDSNHTKGGEPQGCRICSMPVCGACVVKKSFAKNSNTFISRRRHLCDACWTQNMPHRERLRFAHGQPVRIHYAKMKMCYCTAKDGILCTACQRETQEYHESACAGYGCSERLQNDDIAGRICCWCNGALPSSPSKERSWDEYQKRYRPFGTKEQMETQSGTILPGNQEARGDHRSSIFTSLDNQRYDRKVKRDTPNLAITTTRDDTPKDSLEHQCVDAIPKSSTDTATPYPTGALPGYSREAAAHPSTDPVAYSSSDTVVHSPIDITTESSEEVLPEFDHSWLQMSESEIDLNLSLDIVWTDTHQSHV
jgi:hypothetical protein